MCHRVGGVWLFFVFWVEHLLVRSLNLMVVCARACDDLSVCAFLWCWLVVGALLGVWDDTLVVVPVVQVAACCGRAAFMVVCFVVCGCCVRTG